MWSVTRCAPADGVRVSKYTAGSLEQYLRRPGGNLTVVDGNGKWVRDEVWALGRHIGTVTPLDPAYSTPTTFFVHSDRLGTEREKTDVNGWLVESCNSGAWGAQQNCWQSSNAPSIDPDHFTGKQRDPETNLDYFGARYDASSLGRFMTPDPLPWINWQHGGQDDKKRFVGFLMDLQNFDEYAYVLNNPVSATDPTGLYTCQGSQTDCKKIKNAYNLLAQAAKNAKPGSQASKDINRALKALGKPGEKNGVAVQIVKGSAWRMDTRTSSGQTTITVAIKGIENTLGSDGAKNVTAEEASLLGHESSHAADQRAMGMPTTSQQEMATEQKAYTTQGEVDQSLSYNSVFGLWSPSSGLSQSAIDYMANQSLKIWCSEGGGC